MTSGTRATLAWHCEHTLQARQRCDWCWQPHPDLLKCSASKAAHYCGKAHQLAAWKAGYKQECAALVAAGSSKRPTPTMRLAARALWRAARCVHCSPIHALRLLCNTGSLQLVR
jgi:hypothetical protein